MCIQIWGFWISRHSHPQVSWTVTDPHCIKVLRLQRYNLLLSSGSQRLRYLPHPHSLPENVRESCMEWQERKFSPFSLYFISEETKIQTYLRARTRIQVDLPPSSFRQQFVFVWRFELEGSQPEAEGEANSIPAWKQLKHGQWEQVRLPGREGRLMLAWFLRTELEGLRNVHFIHISSWDGILCKKFVSRGTWYFLKLIPLTSPYLTSFAFYQHGSS